MGDNKGSLNRYKVSEGLKNVPGGEMIRAGMVETLCQLDPTGEGNVEYTEFLAATMTKDIFLKDEVCRTAFDRLDCDNDGIISRKDLARLMEDKDGIRDAGLWGTSLGELINELERIMIADESNSGGINYTDFMKLLSADEPIAAATAIEKRRQRGKMGGRKSYASKSDGNAAVVFNCNGETQHGEDLELSSLDGSNGSS